MGAKAVLTKERTQKLYALLKKMMYLDAVENEIANRYGQKERKLYTPLHLYCGQEAIAVGVCHNLKNEDTIFSNHRCHGHYLAKGGNLKAMLAELHGGKQGCCKGKGGSLHLCDMSKGIAPSSGIVAGNVSVATGYALANKIKQNYNLVCVFMGDGATEEGSVYESLCYARIRNIPILYIVENNLYAIHTPLEVREPHKIVSKKFSSIIPTTVIDGNDVEEVNREVENAVQAIRNGEGPILIECMTYRRCAHNGIEKGINNARTTAEWEYWDKKNPIDLAKHRLIELDYNYQNDIAKYEMKLHSEIQEAFEYAEQGFMPDKEDLLKDL